MDELSCNKLINNLNDIITKRNDEIKDLMKVVGILIEKIYQVKKCAAGNIDRCDECRSEGEIFFKENILEILKDVGHKECWS